jgi:hypothetical protein
MKGRHPEKQGCTSCSGVMSRIRSCNRRRKWVAT